MSARATLIYNSPAKVNLHLRVAAANGDGFHPLMSWMLGIDLFDTLHFESCPSGLTLVCDEPSIPTDSSNLVLRAARVLLDHSRVDHGVRVTLNKRIPAGGGLGGGSGNAATALMALNLLWRLDLPKQILLQLAAGLGSDVPFFLQTPSAVCTGRGEKVAPAPPPHADAVVLMLPDLHCSTPAVYRQFDQMLRSGAIRPGPLDPVDVASWASLDAQSLLSRLTNDLEAPAFALRPELAQLQHRASLLLKRPVRMSGSGSTLFTLYDHFEEAQRAARIITRDLGILSKAARPGNITPVHA